MNENGPVTQLRVVDFQDDIVRHSFCIQNKALFIENDQDLSETERPLHIPIRPVHLLRFGRDRAKCHVLIDHPCVSSVHFQVWTVRFDPDTLPITYLQDRSKNGVYVNQVLVGLGNTIMLHGGDKIDLKSVMVFRYYSDEILSDSHPNHERSQVVKTWTVSTRVIGAGSSGTVYAASNLTSSAQFAVKVVKCVPGTPLAKNPYVNEARILMKLNHPNVIKVHEAVFFESNLYIFEDFIHGGDLFSYLVRDQIVESIPEKEAILIVYQLMKALDYLHNHHMIIHRDLKLDNVLLQHPVPCTRIFLCDFGVAKSLSNIIHRRTSSLVGTAEYTAPEVVDRSETGYDFKSDMWSLGIMCHILLSGVSPFHSNDDVDPRIEKPFEANLDLEVQQFAMVSTNAKDFIAGLIKVDPKQRMDVCQCFKHPWIAENEDTLERIYQSRIIKS